MIYRKNINDIGERRQLGYVLVGTKRCLSILADHDMFDNNGSKMGEKDWKHVQASTLLEFVVMTYPK